jgi:hypothetical protein
MTNVAIRCGYLTAVGSRLERNWDKLSSREQGRSPLKYTNYRFCISLERKVCPLEESLGFHKYC